MHVFEDRYRKMVIDAISGQNQIGLVLLKQGWERNYFGSPDVHEIGCVGEIQFSEKLEDGKYNIMLYGVSRVKILKFVQEQPYRVARVKLLKDANFDHDGFDVHYETDSFLKSVRHYLSEVGVKKVNELLNLHSFSFESILNQVASILDFTTYEKQSLLENDSLDLRYESLKKLIKDKVTTLRIAKNVKIAPEDPSWN